MKVLATASVAQFAGAVADRKGDILVAQNKLADFDPVQNPIIQAFFPQGWFVYI